jgi:hypothetical protein
MTTSERFRLSEGLELEPLDDRLLIYNPNGGDVVELNASAALVVQLCDGERTVGAIAKLISDAFPGAASDIAIDIPSVVQELVGDGMLEPV